MTFDLLHIAVRAVFGYVVLLALLRASGKRTIAQGTPFDFVLALIVGDMVDDLLWAEVPAAGFVVAVSMFALLHVFVSWLTHVSPFFERLLSGSAIVLMSNGEPVERELRSEHVAESELEELLRLRGIPREHWPDVETAVLETEGHTSLTMTAPERPAVAADLDGHPGRP